MPLYCHYSSKALASGGLLCIASLALIAPSMVIYFYLASYLSPTVSHLILAAIVLASAFFVIGVVVMLSQCSCQRRRARRHSSFYDEVAQEDSSHHSWRAASSGLDPNVEELRSHAFAPRRMAASSKFTYAPSSSSPSSSPLNATLPSLLQSSLCQRDVGDEEDSSSNMKPSSSGRRVRNKPPPPSIISALPTPSSSATVASVPLIIPHDACDYVAMQTFEKTFADNEDAGDKGRDDSSNNVALAMVPPVPNYSPPAPFGSTLTPQPLRHPWRQYDSVTGVDRTPLLPHDAC